MSSPRKLNGDALCAVEFLDGEVLEEFNSHTYPAESVRNEWIHSAAPFLTPPYIRPYSSHRVRTSKVYGVRLTAERGRGIYRTLGTWRTLSRTERKVSDEAVQVLVRCIDLDVTSLKTAEKKINFFTKTLGVNLRVLMIAGPERNITDKLVEKLTTTCPQIRSFQVCAAAKKLTDASAKHLSRCSQLEHVHRAVFMTGRAGRWARG